MMATLQPVRSLTLDLPPSCIAFCPSEPHLFVVGTYFIHGKEHGQHNADSNGEDDPAKRSVQKRTGSLVLYTLEQEEITCISTHSTDFAILDIQWTRHPETLGTLLAVATSTGLLAFYKLQNSPPSLVLSSTHQITDPGTLVLSLTWHPTLPYVLGVTLSDGSVQLCESSASGSGVAAEPWSQSAVIRTREIHRHSLEAWTCAFTSDAEALLSGGDDSVLQYSSINQDEAVQLWADRKLHEAGVTAILPLWDTLVITGSYDDHIRLLNLPQIGRRKCLAELNLGGGVWRLKILSQESSPDAQDRDSLPNTSSSLTLLASCMYAGARIVRLTRAGEDWSFEVLAQFTEHQSMNYGSDVQPGGRSGGSKKIVSTSFYDRLLCLWYWD